MRLLQDGLIAALAAVGLTTLLWLLVSALTHPRVRPCAAADACVRAEGAAEELEQTVRELLRCRYERRSFSRILIVDYGMDDAARAVAELLARENFGVELVAAQDCSAVLKGAG